MNLRSIDLNLLVILDALLDEAHVTRAAKRLALSQPATSSALERCRHLFKDPLLERAPGRMRLTLKAQALRVPLKQALSALKSTLEPPSADLKTLKRSVSIAMSDALVATALAPLQRRLLMEAPALEMVFTAWHSASEALHRLQQGDIDLAVSVIPDAGAEFRRLEVLKETYVVAMRAKHRGESRGVLDEALARHGRSRHVGLVIPSFLVVPSVLASSDLIALVPSRLVAGARKGGLAVFKPPVAVEGFTLHAAWHARRDDDPAVQYVARTLREVLSALR
jgi:DNA-binding transcriptional LysR family regulator